MKFRLCAWWMAAAISLSGQTPTAQLTGVITDSSDAAVPEAKVTVISADTGGKRSTASGSLGYYTVPLLQPGKYQVTVQKEGFRPVTRSGITLTPSQSLRVDFVLEVGQVSESVTITAAGENVQIGSSEHSAMLTSTQISMIQARGRDVVSLLRLAPGVSYSVDSESVGGQYGISTPNFLGNRSQWNTLSVDGLLGMDLADGRTFSSAINMDAISEVKILLNNFQAEYGRNGGVMVNVVTKSGTTSFHGSGYWYKRHESFNANNFFNNVNNVQRPLYRYSTLGLTLGGPIYVPNRLNTGREKLFFFYSLEDWKSRDPRSLQRVTVPTGLERAGDFSQSLELNGSLMVVKDPLTGSPFAGNIVPASRINRDGQALFNVFPMPNALDRGLTRGNYNYVFQESFDVPKRNHVFKVDYLPASSDRFSVRGSTWWSDTRGYTAYSASAWGLIPLHYVFTDDAAVLNYTRVISPNVANEFSGGVHHTVENGPPLNEQALDRIVRPKIGMKLGQFNPQINPLNIVPLARFGGVPGAASIDLDQRFPLRGADTTLSFSDNLSVFRGSHSLKFGVYMERLRNYEGERGNFSGIFDFGRNVNNPLDSNHAYANALLGNFASYTESSARPGTQGRGLTLEWYGQDSWKITRRLTLEYGVRFSFYTPWQQNDGKAAAFAFERYNISRAPALFRPGFDGANRRVAVNPLSGETFPAVFIGAFVPGNGDPVNGMVLASDTSYPAGFKERQPIQLGPRLGFAYDLTGRGRTSLRGGFGVLYNTRPPANTLRMATVNPPVQYNPIVYYGSMNTFLNSTGVSFPGGVLGFDRNSKTPAVYNFSLGIQRDIGFATLADLSYVGSLGRHLAQNRDLNKVPYGARFLAQNADPTGPTRPLPDNFFRPWPGYGSLTYWENASTSSYHGLHLAVNRRFRRGLQFGLAYTWSKTMNYTDGTSTEGGQVATYRPIRVWDYGKATFDQTHRFVVNYTWDLPKLSLRWSNPVVRHALDNWQLSGVTTFVSGTPSGVGFGTTDSVDLTGGGDGNRIVLLGRAPLGRGERSFSRWFDTSVFARPALGDYGNAPKDVFRAPGINSWDISLFKKIPLWREERYLQLRWEMYNAFNHTQFSSVDATARFDPAGNQVNTRFGQVTGARGARVMQGSVRFTF